MITNKYQKPDVMFVRPTQQQQEAIKKQAVKDAMDKFDKEYGSQPHWKGQK